ncbi:aromatic amino acid aminotransferase [Trichoderma harzianum]|uniref:Aromatic amino acid aminotransferase n=1 Tax=Trichoderma harzianum TaxID=5544 RepID=A0A0F9WWH5_TRIHA|nr:aromatic amino acid aminotransferase [Trichoderma harzianum]
MTLHSTKRDVIEQKSIYDLSIALNYGQGCGSPQLLRWITEHTEMIHNPPYADWQCSMTIGNTSALDMCLRMLTHEGDHILTDKYTFSTAIEMAKPMGINFIGIEMDSEGMLPTSLDKTLTNWDTETNNNTRKPFLLYLIPTGQNPTGTTQSLQRRQDIYKVAQKHDLLILEDDPYYFLQMDEYGHLNRNGLTSDIRSLGDLFKKILPSYLSMDIDGRVIRMDSFSKVISPGARLGWITACKQVIERYQYHTDVSTQSPSGLSQLAFFKLLDEYWGHAGYVKWLIQLRKSYTERRDIFITACERHLPKNVISWVPTHAGMFQWFLIDWRKHPNALQKSLGDLEEEIWLESISAGTLLGKGSWFSTLISKGDTEIFYRATFAAAPLDKIEEAVKQFGDALRKTFKIEIEMKL